MAVCSPAVGRSTSNPKTGTSSRSIWRWLVQRTQSEQSARAKGTSATAHSSAMRHCTGGSSRLPADVLDREIDLPLIARVPHATLPPALDRLAVSGDLADEALVEAGTVRAVPVLAGGPPDPPGGAFEGRHV